MKIRWHNKERKLLEYYNEHKRKPRVLLKYDPDCIDTCDSCKYQTECARAKDVGDRYALFNSCNDINASCKNINEFCTNEKIDLLQTILYKIL